MAAGGVLGRAVIGPVLTGPSTGVSRSHCRLSIVLRAGRDRALIDEPTHALLVSVYVHELSGAEAARTALDELRGRFGCAAAGRYAGWRRMQPSFFPRLPRHWPRRLALHRTTPAACRTTPWPTPSWRGWPRPDLAREGGQSGTTAAMSRLGQWSSADAADAGLGAASASGLARVCCAMTRLVQGLNAGVPRTGTGLWPPLRPCHCGASRSKESLWRSGCGAS